MLRYALWSELLSLELVRAPDTLALLASHPAIELRLACLPDAPIDELARTLRALDERGVATALWPMLDNREGRWASAHNGVAFAQYTRRTLAALQARECSVRAVIVDIEPPIDVMQRWLHRARARFDARSHGARSSEDNRSIPAIDQRVDGDRALAALFEELTQRGVRVGAAMVPTDLLGAPVGRSVEWLLGLPNGDVPYEPASAMLYTSMFEGYSRGWISRQRALSLLRRGASAALRRFGPRAEISLGLLGTGALGDEPTYRSLDELREDVNAVRIEGVERIALFDLRGLLQRPEPARWLEALTG